MSDAPVIKTVETIECSQCHHPAPVEYMFSSPNAKGEALPVCSYACAAGRRGHRKLIMAILGVGIIAVLLCLFSAWQTHRMRLLNEERNLATTQVIQDLAAKVETLTPTRP